jgi:hypothetical protein
MAVPAQGREESSKGEEEMSVKFICDGCGKEEPADHSIIGDAIKPRLWFQRRDEDGAQHACSRECVDRAAAKSGKTDVILPI